ncbi:hypothetical protein [Streptomyces sp. NPDC054837]
MPAFSGRLGLEAPAEATMILAAARKGACMTCAFAVIVATPLAGTALSRLIG